MSNFIRINTSANGFVRICCSEPEPTYILKDNLSKQNNYTLFYKISSRIVSESNLKIFKSYKSKCGTFIYSIIEEKSYINMTKRKNKYVKVLCNMEPIHIPSGVYDMIIHSGEDRSMDRVNEIIDNMMSESLITHGTLADLYYAYYGNIHACEALNDKTIIWYNFNKFGIYEKCVGANIQIWKNIKFKLIDMILERIQWYIDNPSKEYAKLCKFKIKIKSFINRENEITATIRYLAKSYYVVKGLLDMMDTCKPNCLGFNNGVYDMDKMTFRKGEKDEYISMSVGYDYEPENEKYTTRIMEILKSMIPNEDELTYILKKSSLFLVHGIHIREFYSIIGSGANGKGIYALLLKTMLGKYCGSMLPSYFDGSIKQNANSADGVLAKNRLSRLVICDEVDKCFTIDGAKVRGMTSGNTTVSARAIFTLGNDFITGFKLLFISNYEISFDMSASHGDRFDQIKAFRHEFVDNPTEDYHRKIDRSLNDTIMNDKNYGLAMFHILRKYYDIYFNMDKLNIKRPQIMEEERKMLKIENDPVGAFMDEYTKKTDKYDDKVFGSQLFTAFLDYNKGGNIMVSRPVFYQQLSNKHYMIKDFHKQKVIRGIILKQHTDTDDTIEKIEEL
jgi:hypothetical protein